VSGLAEHWAESLAPASAGGVPGWVADLRERGADAFRAHGLPTRRDEAWKYTSLQRLEQQQPRLASGVAAGRGIAAPEPLADVRPGLLLVDGCMTDATGTLPSGMEVIPLDRAWEDEVLRSLLESLETGRRGQGFSALNDATLGRGAVIRVADGTDAGTLLLRWCASGSALVNARVVVLVGEGANLHLVEQFENRATEPSIHNVVVQHELGRSAILAHTRAQEQSDASVLITRTEARQRAGSRFHFTGLDLGGGTARHDVKAMLAGEGAACALHGACLGAGESLADHHMEADHLAAGCESAQLFRAVADGRSRVVFNGRVHVAEGADGTDARQSSAGMLLSKLAEIDAKPELEIHADEVVASHGATVGELDERAMFYLRSRGLREEAARAMLIMAFCRSVTDLVPGESLREALGQRLEQGLAERLAGR